MGHSDILRVIEVPLPVERVDIRVEIIIPIMLGEWAL